MRSYAHAHRDTPHHLKNKRVQQGLLNDKATTLLITHAIQKQNEQKKLKEISIPEVAEADAEADAKGDPIENMMEKGDHIANGELNLLIYIFFNKIGIFFVNRQNDFRHLRTLQKLSLCASFVTKIKF